MKFVCTYRRAIDGSVIYPGTYDMEINGNEYIVKVSDDFNLISTKEELMDCGYFDCSMGQKVIMDEETLLAVYKAVKEEKRKMEEERRMIYQDDKITDEQREEFLTENQAAIRGLNHALNAIKKLGNRK